MFKFENKTVNYLNNNGASTVGMLYHIHLDNFVVLQNLIDSNIIDISSADKGRDIPLAKNIIRGMLKNKIESQRMAVIAEFFMHLFLRTQDFEQQCFFLNLEDNSFKKGFDGLYSKNGDYWLSESKSGSALGITHNVKLIEAIRDLKNKIETRNTNNPFTNAANHILCAQRVDSNKLLDHIRALSRDYENGINHSISEFNIIPVSTLFVAHTQNIDDILNDSVRFLNGNNYKYIILLCFDNQIYNSFLEYVELN